MLNRLPERIEPLHLADKRGEIKGELAVSGLKRLADVLFSDEGSVKVELFFGRDGRLVVVEGHIQAVLQLKCQNCLQAVAWSVDTQIKLAVVNSIEQANRLPDNYDPLLLEQETVSLYELIEDELLLSIPTYPKHQHSCFVSDSDGNKTDLSESENPFSILATLKNTGDL